MRKNLTTSNRYRSASLSACLFAILVPVAAHGQTGCAQLLSELKQNEAGAELTGVTLNVNNIASYISTSLQYRKSFRTPKGILIPAAFIPVNNENFDARKRAQIFSDRVRAPQVGALSQRFDATRSDDLGIEITDTTSPTVTMTLRSWGNARTRFTPQCRDGFITGSDNAGVSYLLRLKPIYPVL